MSNLHIFQYFSIRVFTITHLPRISLIGPLSSPANKYRVLCDFSKVSTNGGGWGACVNIYLAHCHHMAGSLLNNVSWPMYQRRRVSENMEYPNDRYIEVNMECNGLFKRELGPLLLTWINFNPSFDKQLHPLKSMG